MPSIYLSPSKQEMNIGYGKYGSEETRMNQIADVICKCLDASNIKWVRNNPQMTIPMIIEDSNSNKVDFHLALHSNAGKSRGAEVFIYEKGGESEKFANLLYKKISALTPTADRGVKEDQSYAEIKNTKAPSVLVEYAFHDDPDDSEFIINNIESLGISTAQAICEYFDIAFVNPYKTMTKDNSLTDKKKDSSKILYLVQVGAFSDKTNAERISSELKKLGYDNFIVEKMSN